MDIKEKLFLSVMTLAYVVCLADFLARSESDLRLGLGVISCGVLSKVELSNPSGYRGARQATMIYLSSEQGQKEYRVRNKVNEAQKLLVNFTGDNVCVVSLSSPVLRFLTYPVEVSSEKKNVIFKEPLERTYLNSEPYVFWFFLIPISSFLARLLNSWVAKKRENA